jgi:hypothetical protein
MKTVCLLFAVALCWNVTAQDLSAEVAALRREVAALRAEGAALRKEMAGRTPSEVGAPAVGQGDSLRIVEITNKGKYMKLSDGSLWNMYNDSDFALKWGTGATVHKIGVRDGSFQKFKGPDGNSAVGGLEK